MNFLFLYLSPFVLGIICAWLKVPTCAVEPFSTLAANDGALELAKHSPIATMKNMAISLAPHVSFLRDETFGRLSSFKTDAQFVQAELGKLNQKLSMHIQSTVRCLREFKDQSWPPSEGARQPSLVLSFIPSVKG